MTLGFDYETRIDPAALHAAGCTTSIRYTMPQTPFWTKALRNAEAQELLAANIWVVSNFESTADRMRGGAAAGRADALQQLADWIALDAPGGLTAWFSADWNVQPNEVQLCLDYLAAAAAVIGARGRVGVYGGYRICQAAADAGYPIWQTVAWSGGLWDSRAVVRQTGEQRYVGGVQVDVNEIMNSSALGAWTLNSTGGPTMTGGTIPTSITAEDPDLPDIASKFPAGQPFDNETAVIWTDERAAAANEHARQARDAVNVLAAKVASDDSEAAAALQSVADSISTLTTLVHTLGGASSTGTIDVNALAAALGPALASHLTVTLGSQ